MGSTRIEAKIKWSAPLLNILLERGALSCIGAWSGNANRGWSVERWVCVERGAVKSNSLGAWSQDAKIGRNVERWRPPNGPRKPKNLKLWHPPKLC